jgi:hypothetical protein
MTPTTDSTSTRTTTATILRAVADLIENRPGLPDPDCRISFYVHSGEDTPGTMAAIAAALPCGWHARISRGSDHEWMDLDSDIPGASVLRGTQVHISAPASAVCVRAGAKTVTVWQAAPALTGLAGALPLGEVA